METKTCYATIKLALLELVLAIEKCCFYLNCLQHLDHDTDHCPLAPILNSYSLHASDNPQL